MKLIEDIHENIDVVTTHETLIKELMKLMDQV